ncbi:MAG TPA: hypothetical protein VHF25_10635, partial [Nitriliruptorales bacterium]|nr:hypothetical protein [Nitriliruptorales bacterium]
GEPSRPAGQPTGPDGARGEPSRPAGQPTGPDGARAPAETADAGPELPAEGGPASGPARQQPAEAEEHPEEQRTAGQP